MESIASTCTPLRSCRSTFRIAPVLNGRRENHKNETAGGSGVRESHQRSPKRMPGPSRKIFSPKSDEIRSEGVAAAAAAAAIYPINHTTTYFI